MQIVEVWLVLAVLQILPVKFTDGNKAIGYEIADEYGFVQRCSENPGFGVGVDESLILGLVSES